MMRQMVSAAVAGLVLAGAAMAQDARGPVVVELYTSQGCSSCPPADEMVATLAADPGVIVLALHVDYWDYIGWADQFAQPKFTERQKGYARAIGSRTIYTPQLIVGGIDRIEGVAPEALAAALARHREAAPRVRLTAVRTGDRIDIRAEAMAPLAAPARVQLVRIDPEETVTIERGENAGRTITYRNIVTDWQAVAEWPGSGPLEIIASAPGDEPAVVIVQEAGPAGILAAARVD